MYLEGMVESGEFDSSDEAADELDDVDKARIADWLSVQLEAIGDFAKAAAAVRKLPKDDRQSAASAIIDRAQYWADSFGGLGNDGKMSALAKEIGVWKLGSTETHCQNKGATLGCINLDGQSHPLKWYQDKGLNPGTPGSATTCGGFNCDCKIVSRKGKTLIG